MRTLLIISLALLCFAANSLIGRQALGNELIDPVSFTSIRITSALLLLCPLALTITRKGKVSTGWKSGSWRSGIALFLYAIAFSLAYKRIESGAGALILFGAVQVTMLSCGFLRGDRLGLTQWLGFAAALGGVIYLISPGVSSPNTWGAILMCASGISWGAYSVFGKGSKTPILATSGNFARAAIFALVFSLASLTSISGTFSGVILAIICGVVTSGLGYSLWYMSLPRISTTKASILQLLVPPITSVGGILFLQESVTPRLIVSTVIILGGVVISVLAKKSDNNVK